MTALTIWQGAALLALDFAFTRDAEKGGAGCRSTREIADSLGVTTTQARSVLYALADDDLVDCFDERPLEWRITDAGRAAISKTDA